MSRGNWVQVWTLSVLLLILPGLLESTILVDLQPKETLGSSPSSNNNYSSYNYSGLSCVCDGECEHVGEQDCRWGLTLDFCGCCLLCSRGEGEPCGGALGTCAQGLHCVNDSERRGEGTCSRVEADEVKVCSKPIKRFGCLFHGGNCVCENHTVCPGIEMFLFDTEESCRSRIAILMAQRDNIPLATSEPQQQSS
ncbi:unnamed protein product [Allacma fusca]|uniref:IGFBP N-terminal domain-containing protein n=1 Tax=Allacma fusca TaxID=39272 RepID=A0A8J2PCL9_9HEXA|nr:unnamed protein product [Allacma fusca]